MAFEKGWNKQKIATRLRELGALSEATDPKDTRGVQDFIEEAGQFLLTRHQALRDIERLNVLTGEKGPLFDKYPSLKHAFVLRRDQVRSREEIPSLFAFNDTPILYTTQLAANVIGMILAATPDPTGTALATHYVAVSGGPSVLQTVTRIRPAKIPDAYFYPGAIVSDGPERNSWHISPQTNATIAWTRFGMSPDRLHLCSIQTPHWLSGMEDETPEYIHAQAKATLLEHVKHTLEYTYAKYLLTQINAFSLLVTSVENVIPSGADSPFIPDPLWPWRIHHGNASFLLDLYSVSWNLLAQEGAVGCINYSFFDAEGKGRPEWRFFITPGYPDSLEFYRKTVADETGYILVVCTNSANAPALKIALKAGFINWLITDTDTASELMKD